MTAQQNLDAAYDNICRNLKRMTEEPKPTYSVDGVSYSWAELFSAYVDKLAEIQKQRQLADGPWRITSRCVT